MGQTYSAPDSDTLFFLQNITDAEKVTLGKLIADDKDDHAIALTCKLINRKRKGPLHWFGVAKVPEKECNAYGHYVYSLLKNVYWQNKEVNPQGFSFGCALSSKSYEN